MKYAQELRAGNVVTMSGNLMLITKAEFSKSAVGNFGSGWTWLVKKGDGSVDIVNTSNAGTPMTNGDVALLTCDVWEHAYYIDYRNLRAKYVETFWTLVNWKNAEALFA